MSSWFQRLKHPFPRPNKCEPAQFEDSQAVHESMNQWAVNLVQDVVLEHVWEGFHLQQLLDVCECFLCSYVLQSEPGNLPYTARAVLEVHEP